MKIIQEIPSLNGTIRTNVIENVLGMSRADNQYLKGFKLPQWVIWCRLPNSKRYPIAGFPNSNRRDTTFTFLKGLSTNSVVLDYNEHFTEAYMASKQVKEYLQRDNILLHQHLKRCMDRIMTTSNCSLSSLLELDAFKDFSITHIHHWNENVPTIIDIERETKYSKIWAKSLYVPRRYINLGATPQQFFENLIKLNNETINSNIHYIPG